MDLFYDLEIKDCSHQWKSCFLWGPLWFLWGGPFIQEKLKQPNSAIKRSKQERNLATLSILRTSKAAIRGLKKGLRNSIYPDVCVERTNIYWATLVFHKIHPRMESINKGTQEETWTQKWEWNGWPSGSKAFSSLLSHAAISFRWKTFGLSLMRGIVKKARGPESNKGLHSSILTLAHSWFQTTSIISARRRQYQN